ncbi:terminase large subunit domain-containing protein [Novosphingobium humi]|uniref:terminase large subunit domain-containing protein n=1 Tax=Novosphingobium humi TaxID=2282397 RepID=UPI0025B07337|nr:terminase family protein [Novosphingobium humi]WJS98188.1 terminase family protein [Novosphingobium humi]
MAHTPAPDDAAPPAQSRQVTRAKSREARSMYHRGFDMAEIARELGEKYDTVASWKRRGAWDDDKPVRVVQDHLEAKIANYLCREPYTEGDMKRVDHLMRMMERAARIEKYGETGKEGDLNENIGRRNDARAKAKRADKRKNFLSREQYEALLDDFLDWCFEYQLEWWGQRDQRTRKIRKSRQIGATVYFAREAFAKVAEDIIAALAGEERKPRNQIFLSASQRQANKFRREIVNWVRRVTGVELKGNPILLDLNFPAETDEAGEETCAAQSLDTVGFYPLSTNNATAQGESGDFYFDEYAWVHGFTQLNGVASGMATHEIYKKTYFSTPSTKTHQSYRFWSGEEWNSGRGKGQQKPFDISHKNLRKGAIMPDGSWQQLVTIHDAVAKGLGKLVNVENLRMEYSAERFANLFECEDLDDSESSFPYARINPARVDTFLKWRDFRPALIEMPGGRPFGDKPVWLGYDPNKQGRDDAALVVVAPPDVPGKGKFRVLEKFRLNGKDFQGQADAIREVAGRYNVTDISIDTTGSGQAVWENVVKWFPRARKIDYSVGTKTALVIKGQNVFNNGRIEFDADWLDVMQAFIAIRPAGTGSGRGVTYVARRNGEIGHADVAWAILHALSNEPLDAGAALGATGGRVVSSDDD